MQTDSNNLFMVIVKASLTTELWLIIDIRASHEAYDRQKINDLGSVQSVDNKADGLRKVGRCANISSMVEARPDL